MNSSSFQELYYSLIGSADFDDDVGRIGSEARVETTDLIPNFFPEGLIHPFVTLLMLNGLVLKGKPKEHVNETP